MDHPELREESKAIGAPLNLADFTDLHQPASENLQNAQHSAGQAEQLAAALPRVTLSEHLAEGRFDPDGRSVVLVDKTHHKTHVLQMIDGKVEDVLTVRDATGRGPRMTPEGRFHITEKVQHPWWYPPASIGGHPVPPGPHNPLGPAKIRTDADQGRILLHGTNRPDQIGTNASHGCIRHNNADILKIFPLVQKGDAVYIVKNINGATIRTEDFQPFKHQV